ncbi:hypothetical protein CPSG_00425 [Coccidioides posadasii str. Silveira]|uniref:Uncharacterized protein n=1 Tax=Coccidioides posadasii (strain RMSCC 757 / Silveira) TaxID=443226 RepID=E9CS03_COCPS|nr:hypothetical protein CPSG_00425 [Coccidioides posadasii str. Silveira]
MIASPSNTDSSNEIPLSSLLFRDGTFASFHQHCPVESLHPHRPMSHSADLLPVAHPLHMKLEDAILSCSFVPYHGICYYTLQIQPLIRHSMDHSFLGVLSRTPWKHMDCLAYRRTYRHTTGFGRLLNVSSKAFRILRMMPCGFRETPPIAYFCACEQLYCLVDA